MWLLPDGSDPVEMSKFRAAVMQSVICLWVRRHKNEVGKTQDFLAANDERGDGASKWNARLNGRIPLTMQDYATLLRILPDALPAPWEIQPFLDAAEKRDVPLPSGWDWPDC